MAAPHWTATTVAGRIIEAAEKIGLSDTELARTINPTSSYQLVWNWRTRKKRPSAVNVRTAAEQIAKCSFEELVRGAEDERHYLGGGAAVAEPEVAYGLGDDAESIANVAVMDLIKSGRVGAVEPDHVAELLVIARGMAASAGVPAIVKRLETYLRGLRNPNKPTPPADPDSNPDGHAASEADYEARGHMVIGRKAVDAQRAPKKKKGRKT